MLRTSFILAVVTILVVLLGAACSAPAQAPTITPSIPQSAAGPTAEPPSNPPSIQPTTAGAVVAQAPVCQASNSCEALNAEQIQLDCVKKVPYTNVLVPPGSAFEVVDKSGAFICNESGVVTNGKKVITCRGKELFTFDLKLTNPSCDSAALATGTGKCQEGYGYDAAQQCCSLITTGGSSSTTVKVQLAGCPLPNP
jgi:hypothetical protein